MREIKYRAYNKRTKKMYKVLAIFFYQQIVKLANIDDGGKSFLEQMDDIVLMQSTGLKDKNGVEIFEGDVVKILVDNGFDYVDSFGVVRFQQGGFVIDHNNLDTEFGWLYYAQDEGEIEIIGSIYENPDLLEV